MAINNKRIAKNTMALYVRMLLLMAVSLYTSRIVLRTLGVDDYGIYNLIGGFVSLFSFISASLVGAMQRFFNVSLGHNDHEEYRRIYSMGYNIFAIFSCFLLIVGETVGLWFVSTQLNIPEGRETATLWVYQMSLITLIVHLFRTPDNASIIAHERMQFYAYISIFEAVAKLGIVYLLSLMNIDKLILYVVLYLITTIAINIIYRLYSRWKIENCRYCLIWDKRLYHKLVSFSGLYMLTGGTRVVKAQGESFLLNHYFSVAVNAAFGVAAQVYNAVNMFLTNFQTAFNPQLVQSYAAGDFKEHQKLLMRAARLSFFLLLLIVVPVAFNLEGLLNLWLTEVPKYTREFCLFLLLAYLVDAMGAPLGVSVTANGNIKGMQIASSFFLFLGLTCSFFFLKTGAVAYVVAIITFFVHVGFWLCYMYYAHKYSGVNIRRYFSEVIVKCGFVGILSIVTPVMLHKYVFGERLVLLHCLADVAWAAAVIFVGGLKNEERLFMKQYVFKFVKKN